MAILSKSVPQDQPYEYFSLDSKNGERFIRVLRIVSKANEPRLRCSLKVIDLNEPPVYDCLSYTWGDPLYHELSADPSKARRQTSALDHEIECDGKSIPITENLEDALLQFSSTGFLTNPVEGCQENKQGYIWIDAICINQKSDAEKGVQIAMMDEIYSGARRVIAWLGRCDEHTHPALEIIQRLKSIPPGKRKVTITDFESPEYKSLFSHPQISSQQWNDYAAFIQRAWFNRVWVIQEAFLAKHIDVLCGPHTLSWETDIWAVSKFLRETNLGALLQIQAHGTVYPDRKFSSHVNTSLNNQYQLQAMKAHAALKPLSLERVLAYSRFFQATQAQDHVYGLLGVWKSSNKTKTLPKDMVPDYSRRSHSSWVAQVFTQYSWVSIRDTGDLNILSLVDDASTRQVKDMPSWVPDYSVEFHAHPLDEVPRPLEKQRWHANGNLKFQVPTSKDLKKLPVEGILFGNIAEVAATYSELMDQHQINSLLNLLAQYPEKNYPSGCSPVEAFWRTLIKDTFRQGEAKDEAQHAFQYLIAMCMGLLDDAANPEEEEEDNNQEDLKALSLKTKTTIDTIANKYKDNGIIPTWKGIQQIIKQGGLDSNSEEKQKLDRDFDHVLEAFKNAYFCRRLFRTSNNYLGIAAESLKEEDSVWVLAGAVVPVVLRPAAGNGEWELVGEAYVFGIMDGEVVNEAAKEKKRQIELV